MDPVNRSFTATYSPMTPTMAKWASKNGMYLKPSKNQYFNYGPSPSQSLISPYETGIDVPLPKVMETYDLVAKF